MEKRFILAFLLSFIFLVFWGRINPVARSSGNFTQHYVNKEVMLNDNKNAGDVKEKKNEIVSIVEEKRVLENNQIKIELSNINGTINKIWLKKYEEQLPVTNIVTVGNKDEKYEIKSVSPLSIVFYIENFEYSIKKTYSIKEDENLIYIDLSITDKREKKDGIQGFSLDVGSLDKKIKKSQEESLFEYSLNFGNSIFRKANAVKFSAKEEKSEDKNIEWLGFRNKYYCFILEPKVIFDKYQIKFISENKISFFLYPKETAAMHKYSFIAYAGPQDREELLKYKNNFEKIMSFSNWGILNFASNLMYTILHFIYKIVPNWGIAIILTAIFLYLSMYPLTIKNLVSMRRMQSLQPEIAKIRENNKNNPQKMQKETMELYKKHNVNPLGGCLPILVQMPFFIGIYQVLWRSVSFKNAHFLWIKDLSEPDRLFKLPVEIPLIGNNVNLLPILMIIIMFFQQKLSNKNITFSDPAQESQQKMMLFVFPIMIGFIFYNIASGLSLYFTVFYVLSTLTQLKLSKMK